MALLDRKVEPGVEREGNRIGKGPRAGNRTRVAGGTVALYVAR